MERPTLPATKRKHGEDRGFVIPKKKRTEESAGPGGSADEPQATTESNDEITKVQTANQDGLATAVANHYNQLENTGVRDRIKSPIFYLRNFNNWVKSMLIGEFVHRLADESVTGHRPTVLDMGCGKGGDMLKWKKAEIRHLICVDIAETSVEQCRGRYRDMKQRNERERHPQPLFSAEFIAADCTRVRIQEQFRSPEMRVDLVSVQFALHYGFESLQQAERMLENVSDRLRPGGYFIATVPDGHAIMARLQRAGGRQFGNDLFKVRLREPERRPPALFGAQYDFFLEGVVDCPEFLVFLPLLEKLCKKYDLDLVYKKRFNEMFRTYKTTQDGKMLLNKMQALEAYPPQHGAELLAEEEEYSHARAAAEHERCVGTMSRAEWQACSLYMALAFKKAKPAR
ncbi:mRNA cap guanine-N7 methyltransferase-like [Amphibalanus amphitrite]|uniref:mRNA cap guanine-N7 methyltransferase-like n=1 Tax=Amphibalanus amphitrite TaxID=1232801 RepID=UPI001C91C767|nr:mRNA cap guanine-N7 methyltransferase-like [Amphibalanus amphitrite]XP_043216856.1 mRNA cap guanine-N7 methyltransferase-like [Amphibalanus amphitrite]XP_043216857.1 mRNA cap guanine-N7 methyltransferase-like [Amphibalanus amphitrite]XP_043216858.1 mRNA cap guanine-N7 methyltransferase-like [Amphibalanus amphitrite]XP_043216859.1 mRNA cap guanine-N7 methyltransferase-like [Amphibalanus amphitrite]XP_043216861.1 mRNA cap guanine-N7 methyltransferase-like [Amphibalanus amphitrite]